MKTNWSESAGSIWFGQGHARREVLFDIGGVEEERGTLEEGIDAFQAALHDVYGFGDDGYDGEGEGNGGYDMVV